METTQPSDAFNLLDERIQHWIWDQGWTELRDAQEAAVVPILSGLQDVIISAATAGGKTEAAFLPICSKVAASSAEGLQVLYLSPLKALINDQYDRLDEICKRVELPVHRWHGDVPGSKKKLVLREPSGILIITPESLEALFVNHGTRVEGLFSTLQFVVIDELHAFIGNERGMQLQSLLHRIELILRKRIPRIGLSATLGDMMLAADFLRPGKGAQVLLIVSSEQGQEIRLQLRGYRIVPPRLTDDEVKVREDNGEQVDIEDVLTGDTLSISADLFSTLRGTDNLIYANRRRDVELYADLLRRTCERERVPNEFWPHHGSLSKDIREDVEAMLKSRERQVNVVCTTTLELGIDIGNVVSIAQLGPPPSVSSMRQRLGRSGRRGGPAILRIYVQEDELTETSTPQDALRPELVQSIAMVELLIARWYEPPSHGALHLSTLVQQVLSLIAQYGGISASDAWLALCRGGPFAQVGQETFMMFLRSLGDRDLILQSVDGSLLLGILGERIVNHFSFYTAFVTPEEYRLVSEGRTLGTLPIEHPLADGMFLIFAGRRWRVISVDQERKVVELKAAAGGRPPVFGGTQALVHDRVRKEMRRVYEDASVPRYLDASAEGLLEEGRKSFASYELDHRPLLANGEDTLLFLWAGDRIMNTVAVELRARGLDIEQDGIALTLLRTSPEQVSSHLKDLVSEGPSDGMQLAATVENKWGEKYDRFLWEELMCAEYASRSLDPSGAWETLARLFA